MDSSDQNEESAGPAAIGSGGGSRDSRRRRDTAWAAFFRQTDTLQQIRAQGYSYITADQLNALKLLDARLMTKLDTLDDRPDVFKEHNLAIFPVRNGRYILFRDPEHKSYFRLGSAQLELPPQLYQSSVDLAAFDSFPGLQRLNESQALDFALVSSLLRQFTGDNDLHLVIRGRTYSGQFVFDLPEAAHRVEVSSVQIEVDGGYESRDAIYLVEAKTGRRADFHIRQLYYPFLEWSARSAKRVVPIFFFVTNGKFYFFEFRFEQAFGALSIVRAESYVINESPKARLRLAELMGRSGDEGEPPVPFPQANDLDKVVDLLALLRSRADAAAGSGVSKADIAEHFEFDERQGDYYANAGVYLGLIQRSDNGFVLSELGSQVIGTRSLARRTEMLVEYMLRRPVLRDAFALLQAHSLTVDQVRQDEVAAIISHHTSLSGTTPARRASTVLRWLRWVADNAELVE